VEAVAVEAVVAEAVVAEAVAAEAVAVEAVAVEAVAVEAVVAEVVADLEILKEITQVMAVEATSPTAVKHVVKVINLVINQSKATKVAGLKVAVIIEAEAIVDNAVTEIDYSSSSTFFCLMGENIPLSSMISLAPGRIERISSVISPVFL
jgi:hypothetical protein